MKFSDNFEEILTIISVNSLQLNSEITEIISDYNTRMKLNYLDQLALKSVLCHEFV